GNKDPFTLRRAALSLARTLIETKLDLDLKTLLRDTINALPEIKTTKTDKNVRAPAPTDKAKLADELREFVFERLRGYYADQGFSNEQFEAVRTVEIRTLIDFDHRLRAVTEFARLPEAQALAAANKRTGNILRQAGGATA